METEKFNLSNRIHVGSMLAKHHEYFWKEDVKEFIRLLKEWINEQHIHFNSVKGEDCDKDCWGKTFPNKIDKLAGDKLR